MSSDRIVPIIMCGGGGTRMWPESAGDTPKQFLEAEAGKSWLRLTLERVADEQAFRTPVLVTNAAYADRVQAEAADAGMDDATLVTEPEQRNTAAAVAAAVRTLMTDENDPVIAALPSDHWIDDDAAFRATLLRGAGYTDTDRLVIFGVRPTRPDTNMGYIAAGEPIDGYAETKRMFVEKPTPDVAREMNLYDGHYWNAGIFMGRVSTIARVMAERSPECWEPVRRAVDHGMWNGCVAPDAATFAGSADLPFDKAVLERHPNVAVLQLGTRWSDVGNWKAVWEISEKDENHNVLQGPVKAVGSVNVLARTKRPVGVIGCRNIGIIEHEHGILVTDFDHAGSVKELAKAFNENGSAETATEVHRPWGKFENLARGENHHVKRITVDPGKKLSLQYHHHRSEHWTIVSGSGFVVRDQEILRVTPGSEVFIPIGAIHRIGNDGDEPLVFIETQTGDELREDDIVRVEDDYKREAV